MQPSFVSVILFQGEVEGSKLYQGLLKKAKHQFSEALADENRLVNNFHIAKLENLRLFKSCFYVTSPADYSLSVSNF